ncbi:hypothetical protein GGX14DRAFT_580639 [Mycena pura]|uniref:Uncharacterized protein n=1 Tax=Mycena pura TaxID=153505 RepID=A0AAD6USF1_9AGAR|nr:hypothetical protein GGX14DRAFT_580639 [Mycena pura]
MLFKSIASLAAFAVAAIALEDSAHLFLPDGALGACGEPVLDTEFAAAISSVDFSLSLCGQTITVFLGDETSSTKVDVVIKDNCTLACHKNQIELTQAAFDVLVGVGSPDQTVGPVTYNLPA